MTWAVSALGLLAAAGCRGPEFTQAAIDRAMLGAGLPSTFWLSVATSAYQTEGNTNSDWEDWELGKFPDGTPHVYGGIPSGRADGSWDLWAKDIAAMEYLGANGYRMSLEWSKLEPQEGQWDEAAFAHYREQLTALRKAGIEPLVTVQHITLPKWVAAHGGWEWDGFVDALARHAAKLGEHYGDLVDNWCTINEPNAIFTVAYVIGRWAPGVTDTARGMQVYARTLDAHAAVAKALRATDTVAARGPEHPATFIGLAHNMVVQQPASSSPLDLLSTSYGDDVVNEMILRGAATGNIDVLMPGQAEIHRFNPDLKGSFDYIGLNYYRRTYVRVDANWGIAVRSFTPAGDWQTGLGWSIDVEGFYDTLKRCAKYGLPVLVTENGAATDDDNLRQQYLRAHIYALERAIADGVDVRGYYHWTLADNFELNDGFHQKCGLFSLDPNDPALTRVPRGSAETFREIARGMGRTPRDVLP